jgi:hypothetical protein
MALRRWYYSESIAGFLQADANEVLGELTRNSDFDVKQTQRDAWLEEISILNNSLPGIAGSVYFEYSIPRMGKRIDVVLIVGPVIFVLEFKVGERTFTVAGDDQACDYALDLKNFHESSAGHFVAPIVIATAAKATSTTITTTAHRDQVLSPIRCNREKLRETIESVLRFAQGGSIDPSVWEQGRYCPTPTIIEAALALYNGHGVEDITRRDAEAINLSTTSEAIANIIANAKANFSKSICFVTGVPGAGKTLVGLDTATKHIDKSSELHSVFLSGNGPLVNILCEALARDKIHRDKECGVETKKGVARSAVKMFIQNVHHYRDDCLIDQTKPPMEHVALFDEAQRAWNLEKTADFMKRKKGTPNFRQSEPEFLISCLDRHQDWAVIVCLVGGGQEINIGEAGISEWIDSLNRSFPEWHIHVSSRLTDTEYGAGAVLDQLQSRANVSYRDELHLSVSMRSFRAENVSSLVKDLLDINRDGAMKSLCSIANKYPIAITRDLTKAKRWLRDHARGTQRYGVVVSSKAHRLKPHAIDVRPKINPIYWFLNGKKDVRSSYFLEDVATEFDVQGLELDWACVTWDADFRFRDNSWEHWSFRGNKWQSITKADRQAYLKNAYRVLLTRARQGMVIAVPQGEPDDPTRKAEFYDPTFDYLSEIGFDVI